MNKLDLFLNYLSIGVNPVRTSDVHFIDKQSVSIELECVVSFLSFGADSEAIELPITLSNATITPLSPNNFESSLQLTFDEGTEGKTFTARTTKPTYINMTIVAQTIENAEENTALKALDAATFSIVATANDLDTTITFSSTIRYQAAIPALVFHETKREPPRHAVRTSN